MEKHRIVEKYLADLKRKNARANQMINAESYLNKFYDWAKAQGIKNYQFITKKDITDFRNYLINDYRTRQDKNLGRNSINAILTHIRNHFDWLKKTGKRRDNPTRDIDDYRVPKKDTYKDIKYLEQHEVEQLKDYFRKKEIGPHAVLLTQLTFEEGLRIGEALALDISDIYFERNKINIDKSLNRAGKVGPCKSTKSEAVIKVTQSLMDDIRDYIDSHRSKKTKSTALFVNGTGRFTYTTVEYWIKTANKHLHFRHKLTWHLGRHSACSNMIANGIPLADVKVQLRHSHIKITANYLHALESRQDKNAQIRERYIQNAKQNGSGAQEKTNKLSALKELFSGLSKEEKLQLLAEVIS